MADIKMEAEIIFEPHVPNALRRALDYAGDDGFVASMPQLLHARTNASYDNIIWNDSPGNNPITNSYGATMAWCDPGQPFLNSVVSLDAYAGKDVRFRWRMGTDSAAGGEGWFIDDVKVQSCASAQEKIYLPYMETDATNTLAGESHTEAPSLGLIILPALIGILPVWGKHR